MNTPEPEDGPIPERPPISLEFAADLLARMQAHMASRGLLQEMLSPLDTEAVQMHVVLEALMRAGFTEDQALKYLAWRHT